MRCVASLHDSPYGTSLSAAVGRDGLSSAFLNQYWTKFDAVFASWTEGLVAVPTLVSTCFESDVVFASWTEGLVAVSTLVSTCF